MNNPDHTHVREDLPIAGRWHSPSSDWHHHLVVTAQPTIVGSGKDLGRRFVITVDPVEVGRSPSADITIDDPSVSGRHCRARQFGNALAIEDLGSTNGTYIDGRRVNGAANVRVGQEIQVGDTILRYECRSTAELLELEGVADLKRAATYVRSLLPAPFEDDAWPFAVDWCFEPSALVGGDSFGYHAIDDDYFAFYLIDVSGHGVGSTLHSVAALNTLRGQTLPNTDFTRPSQVLSALNRLFDMQRHGGMYFTLWYGVWQRSSQRLEYASAGHPPAIILRENASSAIESTALATPSPGIGLLPDTVFGSAEATTRASDRLFIVSDGAFELEIDDTQWQFADFERFVIERTALGADTPQELRDELRRRARRTTDDDFSLVCVFFGDADRDRV